MEYNFIIKHDQLMLTSNQVGCTNNVNMYICKFRFLTEDWNGLIPFATFKINNQYYTSRITDGECTLPVVDKAQAIYVGVYGLSGDSAVQKRLPTNWIVLNISEGAYIPGATVPPAPPEVLWDEYSARVEEVANSLEDKANANNVYTKADTDNLILAKADKSEVYTKTETDIRLGDKVDKIDGYGLVKGNIYQAGDNHEKVVDLFFDEDKYIAPVPNLSMVETTIDTKIINKADKSEVNTLKYQSIPHTTATGYPVTLTDHLVGEELISCKVFGTAGGVGDLVTSGEQQGKYKIPVKVEGKNLFNYAELSNAANYTLGRGDKGVYYVKFPAGTYTFSCNVIATAASGTSFSAIYIEGETLVGIATWAGSTTPPGKRTITFSPTKEWYIRAYHGGSINTQERLSALLACFEKIQLERGNTATPYEAYVPKSEKTVYLNSPLLENQYTSIQGLNTLNSEVNTITTDTAVLPSKIEVEYYQDINKVVTQIKNAILANGGNI